jgi:myosin heavy subunit
MTEQKKRQALAEQSKSSMSNFDPSMSSFERQDSIVYGTKAKELAKLKGSNPAEYTEVKEYMDWRLKRNKKRLQRLQGAARIIQGAFRAYLARMFVRNLRRRKAATIIQRAFRGWLGRCSFLDQARRIWASQVIQRSWRGYLSRKWFFYVKLRIASAANIQRVFRGFRGRNRVKKIMKTRHKAACKIQALGRRYMARMATWRKRIQRNASVLIQRCYRGRLGRRKASNERDKYIFSRSQSQGIEFGRQMLLEHKLHATRLQSDVTLLMQEKVSAEEQVEALLEEISSFEDGVRTLQKEMHQLSKVEAEAAAFMDEESKFELREQKMRLDKEFGDMLAKIGNRKDMLNDLEKKLGSIDKARQGKEEELRTLERKLVVLLEEQQNELNAIKKKQDVRGAMLAASHDEIRKLTIAAPGSQSQSLASSSQSMVVSNGGGGGGGSGPSLQEKRQAAQLMQSTETLMKFGFMSMSMTYFSSLNMIKALRTVSAQDTVMAA